MWYGEFQSYIFKVIIKHLNGFEEALFYYVPNVIGLTGIINALDICYRSCDLRVHESTLTFSWLISKSVANVDLDRSPELLWVKMTAWPGREP